MRTVEIKTFEQVILFTLQKKMNAGVAPEMKFSEIWNSCALAGPRLPHAYDANRNRREFVRHLFETLKFAETMELISLRTSSDDSIESIALTEGGSVVLQAVIFSHQDRMQGV